LKPAWANSLQDYISKNPSQKGASGVAQGVVPEFKPQSHQFKEKKKKVKMRLGVVTQACNLNYSRG
jgi:hypothetical protein